MVALYLEEDTDYEHRAVESTDWTLNYLRVNKSNQKKNMVLQP